LLAGAASIFGMGFFGGYGARALVSARHRHRFKRTRGYPLN
jgi:hypothetical protein